MKNIVTAIIVLLFPLLGFSQQSRLKYANKMFENKAYFYASEGYEDVLARGIDSLEIANNLAISYDKMGDAQKAANWYRFMSKRKKLTVEQYTRLALLERQLGNYELSDKMMGEFAQLYNSNDIYKLYKSKEVEYTQYLQTDPGMFSISNLSVNGNASEIGVNLLDSSTVLVSSNKRSRMISNTVFSWEGNHFYDLYTSRIKSNGELSKLKALKAKARTRFHDGPSVYCAKSGYLYFTRNNSVKKRRKSNEKGETLLKIYKMKFDDNRFGPIEELSINSDTYSTAHPAVSADGKHLYFSSDRPGGLGGMDLYIVSLDDNGAPVGAPTNLGPLVNTSRNEVFPTICKTENALFFSSDGLVGLGGLDVFMAPMKEDGTFEIPENLRAPLNSSADDFGFVLKNASTGYFISNRSGGKGSDDIYAFEQLKPFKRLIYLEGLITDRSTGVILPDAAITVTDNNGNIVEVNSDQSGRYRLPLELDRSYSILSKHTDYFENGKAVSTTDLAENVEVLNGDIELEKDPGLALHTLVTDAKTGMPLDSVKLKIIDLTTGRLFVDTVTTLTGDILEGIMDHKLGDKLSYSISMERNGYFPKVVKFDHKVTAPGIINAHDLLDGGHGLEMDRIVKDVSEMIVINDILFDYNKFNIRPDAAIELDKIVSVMNKYPSMVIELGSHTDCRGTKSYNEKLSDKRAKASAAYIQSRINNPERIYGKGYGESKLLNGCACEGAVKSTCSEEEHQMNRRTEFRIVKFE